MRNIKDYGAIGDGETLNTAAIQKAIDDGGMVYVPDGTYITGTLYLKSNGGLHLAPGAVLKGSHNRADYNADDFCPQNRVFSSEWVTGAHLIVAIEQENVTLEGHGTIDGEGNYWMNASHVKPTWLCEGNLEDAKLDPDEYEYDYIPNEERPAQMIFFCECKNVHVSDINIVNGPYWHLFFHGCADVFARGLNIKGERPRWTNDGIDIDCCKNVTVSDCHIDVGDDAIAIRAYKEPLLYSDGICENVLINNCVIRASRDYGIRIGVGNGLIRNCRVSNMSIEAPNVAGIGIMGRWSSETKSLTQVENIAISNSNIKGRHALEFVVAYGDAPLAETGNCYVKNIVCDNLFLYPTTNNLIKGRAERSLDNVILRNITVFTTKDNQQIDRLFEIDNANGVILENVNIWDK